MWGTAFCVGGSILFSDIREPCMYVHRVKVVVDVERSIEME